MKRFLQGSLFWQLLLRLHEWYQAGAFAAFFRAFALSYPASRTHMVWEHFVWAPLFRDEDCLYLRFGRACRRGLRRLGLSFQNSLIYRLGSRVGAPLARFLGGGVIGRVCRFFGVRGLLIVAVALYLPIDYVLRDYAPAFLASLWDEGLMLLVFAYVCWRRGMERAPSSSRATPLDSYLILFIGVLFFLMCAESPYLSIAISGYRAVVQYLLWFFLMIRLIEDDHDFSIFYGTLLTMAILVGLHGIYQFIVAAPIPASWVSQTEESVRTRVYSIMGSPNIMGAFLVLFAPMMAALAWFCKKSWGKALAMGATGVMCLSVLFTFSKGAWGGLVVAILVFALFMDRRLIALMAACGAGALLLVPSIANRITYLFTADYVEASLRAGRMVRWETGLQLLAESNPLLGFGLGRFGGAVAMQNKIMEETDTFQYFYMDNYYMKTLVESGYLGLIFYLLLLLGLVLWCLRALGRTRKADIHPLAVGMFAGMAGVLFHCYYENIFEVPYMMAYFWSLAAGVLYLGYFRKRRAEAATPPRRLGPDRA